MWLFGSFAVTAWIVGTIFFFTFRNLDRRDRNSMPLDKAIVKGFLEKRKQRLSGLRSLMLVHEMHGMLKMGAVRLRVLTDT